MKNKLFTYLFLVVFAVLGVSCYDDEGNYTYQDINEVSIGGLLSGKAYEAFAFLDTLRICPVVEGTFYKDDLKNYEFEWKIIPLRSASDTADYVVSREKDLSLPVFLDPGEYAGFYKVKDKVGDTEWGAEFKLNVKTMTSEGWMVLCEENGEARMDLIAHVDETDVRVARNLWRNEEYQTGKPYAVYFDYDAARPTTLLSCEAGTYVLDANLEAGEKNNLKWSFGSGPARVDIRATGSDQLSAYVVNREFLIDKQGDLYFREWLTPGSLFDFPMNYLDGERIELAPWVGIPIYDKNGDFWTREDVRGHSTLFYDNTHKQFVALADKAIKLEVADFNGVQVEEPGCELVYMQSVLDNYTYAIFKSSEEDEFYIYKMQLVRRGNQGISWKAYTLENSSEIRKFAFDPVDANHYLYYATDCEVFRLDLSNGNVKEVLFFPDDEIAVFKFNPMVTWNGTQKDWELNRRKWLVIGLNEYDGDETACGTVQFYEYSEKRGKLVLKKQVPEEDSDESKLGKIVDITYRER